MRTLNLFIVGLFTISCQQGPAPTEFQQRTVAALASKVQMVKRAFPKTSSGFRGVDPSAAQYYTIAQNGVAQCMGIAAQFLGGAVSTTALSGATPQNLTRNQKLIVLSGCFTNVLAQLSPEMRQTILQAEGTQSLNPLSLFTAGNVAIPNGSFTFSVAPNGASATPATASAQSLLKSMFAFMKTGALPKKEISAR